MLKTLIATSAISGLMLSGALAQSPAPSMDQPAKSDRAAGQTEGAMSQQFIAAQKNDQFVASKFKGTDVVGPDDSHIGDVSDMLFSKDGKILAYIVGVGGFLGIGEKNVAIEPSAFQMMPADSGSSDTTSVKLKVAWTKDQLKNAPAFEYYKSPAQTTGTGSSSNTGMAPRPAAPPAGR